MRSNVASFMFVVPALLSACRAELPPQFRFQEDEVPFETREWIYGRGPVEPTTEIRHLAFGTPGIVESVRVEVGENVPEGTELMAIDSDVEVARLAQSEAELSVARARLSELTAGPQPEEISARLALVETKEVLLRQAKRNLDREKELIETGSTLPRNLEIAETEFRRAETEAAAATASLQALRNSVRTEAVEVARQEVRIAERQVGIDRALLRKRTLRAPCRGTVIDILAREGDRVGDTADPPAILFADLDSLRIAVEVDESLALEPVDGGMAEVLTGEAGISPLQGRVVLVKAQMGRKSAFSRQSDERQDRNIREVYVQLPAGTMLPLGLEVDVRIRVELSPPPSEDPLRSFSLKRRPIEAIPEPRDSSPPSL